MPTTRTLLKAANACMDVLKDFQAFRTFTTRNVNNHDFSFVISNVHAKHLDPKQREEILQLFEFNMKEMYQSSDWGYDPIKKREELFEEEARYLIATNPLNGNEIVGFIHFRFLEDDGIEVVYIYEIQIAPKVQRIGLGKFLMQIILLVASKHKMQLVVLTVFKSNKQALSFYQNKMGFEIDETSPSQCDEPDASYEILSRSVLPSSRHHDR
jgi:ribosomal protein S18 acetylase RimI-like enzyme